jgi:diadenosine tetraphosphate (Ap4A) HIT family hydrolase
MSEPIINTETTSEIPLLIIQAKARTPLKLDDEGKPYFVVPFQPTNELFSIDSTFGNDLDNCNLSSDLRGEFGKNGISLSPSATISIKKRGYKWLITDRDNQKLLFHIDLMFRSDLDKKCVSADLRRVFRKNGISLSQNATISIEEPDNQLLIIAIIDGDQLYSVRQENGQFNIYKQNLYTVRKEIGTDGSLLNVYPFDNIITSIPDALGINGETLIGQGRASRPKPDATYAPKPSYDKDTVEAIFPILLQPENEWVLNAIVESTDNGRLLEWMDLHLDEERFKSLKRKIRLNPAITSKICTFCRDKHSTELPQEIGYAFSSNNPAPFGPFVHKVLILTEPEKHYISQITFDDILGLYEEVYSIAVEARKKFGELVDGLNYGSNIGEYQQSGASQPHLHSQLTAIGKYSFNAGDKLGLMCQAYLEMYNRDYLADYIKALDGANLVLAENEHAILYVPIAQRFNAETQIMVKNETVGNILNTTDEIRRAIAKLEYKAFEAYQGLKLQSFNTVMYATRFSTTNNYQQRLIVSIYPRTAKIGFSELADHYVIDELPWDSAEKIRDAIKT